MHAKCSVFIATSLDGYISREDGSIDWLMKACAPDNDGGYKAFISTVDGLIMGRNSYEKALSFDEWPYGNLPIIVMSRNTIAIPEKLSDSVSSSSESPADLVRRLTKSGAAHLYIDGGLIIQSFLADGLINEMTVTLIPVLLGSGRPLFGPLEHDIELQHIETRDFSGGFVQVKYRIDTTRI